MAKKPDSKPEENEEPNDALTAESLSQAGGIVDVIEKNRLIIIGATVGIIAVLLLIIVGKQLGNQRHLKAGLLFTEAATARDIGKLDEVANSYRGSISGGNALITKADIQIDQGKPQDAIATLNQFADEYRQHPRYAQSYFMLANLYHKSGDLDKAGEQYQKVLEIQPDGEFSPISRIRLGDLAMARKDEDAALQNYRESYTIHPGNPFVSLAESRIRKMKVGNPPVVDRPEPPKPPEESAEPAKSEPAGEGKPKEEAKEGGEPAAETEAKEEAAPETPATEEPAPSEESSEAPAEDKPAAPADSGEKDAPSGESNE